MQSHKRPFTLFLTPKVFHLIILQRRWLKDTGRVNRQNGIGLHTPPFPHL